MSRIYLDNAATSWPKPVAVYDAVDHYQRSLGAPAGRGAYREAVEVERLIQAARRGIAGLVGATDPRQIIFTLNGTDSLNQALQGLLRPGDHAITSAADHNSTLRPLRWLESYRQVEVTRLPCDADGIVDVDECRRAIRPNTRLISLIHVSNVTGAIQPVAEVGKLAHEHGVRFVLDAAQSLGHISLNLKTTQADLIAAPGHKGLLGPLGTGILALAPGIEREWEPVRQGGTGTRSESDAQPTSLPDRYESGNLNAAGIIGLGAGVQFLADCGWNAIRNHEQELTRRVLSGLYAIPGVRVFGPEDLERRVGVVSFTVAGYDPQEVAALLDSSYSIQTRAGLHCAPRIHTALGTDKSGGTVRISVGPFTTVAEVDAAVMGIGEIVTAR